MQAWLKDNWRMDAAAAILVGALPVIGVLFWHWSPFALIFLFWLENVVIGVRQAFAMLIAGVLKGGAAIVGAVFLVGFFCVHYGIFCAVHGAFVIAMFGGADPLVSAVRATPGSNPADVFGGVLSSAPNFIIAFGAISARQILHLFLTSARGELARTPLNDLMGQPYPRIMALHFTILFGGMIAMALGWPGIGVLMLALIKAAGDAAAIWAGRRKSTLSAQA